MNTVIIFKLRLFFSLGLLFILSSCGQGFRPAKSGNAQLGTADACPTGPMTCVLLSWDSSTTAGVSYHIWYGKSPGVYTTELDAGTALTYQVQGLTPGRYYLSRPRIMLSVTV